MKNIHNWCWAVLLLCAGASVEAADTLRYTVIMEAGTVGGHQIVTRADNGVTTVDYDFKDNGRGPTIKERYRLAPDGTYVSYRAKGTSTFGAPVDETFSRNGNEVR